MVHTHPIRIYFEDTDLAGVVYYANYLKFTERGRSEFIRSLGFSQIQLKQQKGCVFAVRTLEANFIIPAQFDDQLCVLTKVCHCHGARLILSQDIHRNNQVLFTSIVTLVCVNPLNRPTRIPHEILEKLK